MDRHDLHAIVLIGTLSLVLSALVEYGDWSSLARFAGGAAVLLIGCGIAYRGTDAALFGPPRQRR